MEKGGNLCCFCSSQALVGEQARKGQEPDQRGRACGRPRASRDHSEEVHQICVSDRSLPNHVQKGLTGVGVSDGLTGTSSKLPGFKS